MTLWILILLTFLPFLAAIIAYMLGRRDERAMNGFVSITGIVIFALSVVLLFRRRVKSPCPASADWDCTCVRTASAGCTAALPPSCG